MVGKLEFKSRGLEALQMDRVPKAKVAALELVVVTGAIVHTGCAALDASDKEKNAKAKKKGEGDCQNRTSDLPGCNGLLYL